MPVRLKDIALDLGVSVVTVSKVLRNHADISTETRERVMRRMKELNYQPNLAARALVTGRSCILGLVVPDLVHPFFAQIAKRMSFVLREQGYNVVISSSDEDPELEQQEIQRLLARRADALIIASSQKTPESFKSIEQSRTPYVLIDRNFSGFAANYIGVDDTAAGDLATEHLIDIGRRAVAHIGGPEVSTALGRLDGYRRALTRHGLPVRSDYIVLREHGDEASDVTGGEAMRELLGRTPCPDAVFCYNDPTAMGAMKAILDAGLRIPEDIAIAGCGNVFYAGFLRVPLTSVDQSSDTIAETAAKLALSLINAKGALPPETVLLQPKLVIRESTRKL